MVLFGKLNRVIFDKVKPLRYMVYEHFNEIFKKRDFKKLLKIYFVINKIETISSTWIEMMCKCDRSSNKYLEAFVYPVESVKQFCELNNCRYSVVEMLQDREVYAAQYCNTTVEEKVIHSKSPDIYIAEITNASVIGENSVIIAGNTCLYDMAKRDYENRYNLKFGSLRNIDSEHAVIRFVASNVNIEKAIALVGFAATNYYHFTIELISRLSYIEGIEAYREFPLMIDENALEIPQCKQILEVMNKYDREIIPIKKNHLYDIGVLVYPSYNTWLPINLKKKEIFKPEDFLMAKKPIVYIRNRVKENILIKEQSEIGNRRIFISRRNTRNARLRNEAVVIEIVKKYNFEIVYPEELSFQEQVEMFAHAEYVVGTTGAAFTNVIFCPRNAKIMCIIPQEYEYYGYSTLARLCNLECVFFDAQVLSKKEAISMEYYRMDLDYLKKCLETFDFE